MTEEQKAEAIKEQVKAHKAEIAERKKAEIKDGFLNPFGQETSYEEFLEQVEKSKKSVADYCKGKITQDELSWLEKEIELFNKKKK